MRVLARTVPALLSLALLVASCVGGDEPTSATVGVTGIAIQPALIPGPADADALPINRVRAVTIRLSDGALLDRHEQEVSPTAASWTLELSVPVTEDGTVAVVFLFLINVTDGTESIEFSGRSDPITLVLGGEVSPDVPFVRGPLENLDVLGVTITTGLSVDTLVVGPDTTIVTVVDTLITMAAGTSRTLVAEATTSGSVPPTIFWTSLDESVVTMDGSTATAVGVGTTAVVASAGAHEDRLSITVSSPLTAPVISNLKMPLLELNYAGCTFEDQSVGSLFAMSVDFTDSSSDVTPNGSLLDWSFTFRPSGNAGTFVPDLSIAGTPSAGTVSWAGCFFFSSETSVDLSVRLIDDGGLESNLLTANFPKPNGANVSSSGSPSLAPTARSLGGQQR